MDRENKNEHKHTSMDISFIVLHQEALDDEDSFQYVLQLGQQAQRYDKNS
jgi:hypothetical protein